MKNEIDTFLLLEKLNSISNTLTKLENSLAIVYGTPEESCEHYAINEAKKDVFSIISMFKH